MTAMMFALDFLISPPRYRRHISDTGTLRARKSTRMYDSRGRRTIFIESVSDPRTCVYTSSYVRLSIHLDSHYRPLTGRLKYLPAETFASRPIIMIGASSAPLCARTHPCATHTQASPLNYAGPSLLTNVM